ncbi:MAG: TPM domain-containing protein, partial [Sphingomonadaceae bacterium]|nr:TPM domain-containing protein [Sphingomonadaceae bacterium]
IEVGYGLEPVLTDGLSHLIINQQIVPLFRKGDMPGGIEAGTDAIIKQLTLPPEEAQKIAAEASRAPKASMSSRGFIFMIFVVMFFILPVLRAIFGLGGGRRYSGRHSSPIIWAPGGFSGGSSGGFGGGFSGGGGSFGGGGSSGGW